MKTNDALRAALQMNAGIGGLRIGKNRLNQQQINHYLLVRVIDLEDTHFKAIGALQKLGMECCDECEEWHHKKEVVQSSDRVQCLRCFTWDYFVGEHDTDEEQSQAVTDLVHQFRGTERMKLLPHNKAGTLEEPFLAEYRKQTSIY